MSVDRRSFLALLGGSFLFPGFPEYNRVVWSENIRCGPLTKDDFDEAFKDLFAYGGQPKWISIPPEHEEMLKEWANEQT